MEEKEVIEQIESLIDDRNSFINPTDKDDNNDANKINQIIKYLKQLDKKEENK